MNYNKYLSFKNILKFSTLNYLQAGVSFIVSFFLAKYLGKTAYGYYAHGLIFANMLSVLIQFGQDKTLVRDFIQTEESPANIFWAATIVKGALGLFGLGCIAIWFFGFSDLEDFRIQIILICSASGVIFGLSPKAWFDFQGKINYQALILLIDRLLFTIGSLSILYFFSSVQVVIGIALCLLASRIFAAFLEWKYVFNTVPISVQGLYKHIRIIVLGNIFVFLAAIGNLCMTQVNQLVLQDLTNAGELGLYGFALQIIMLVRLLQMQLTRLATPSIASIVKSNKAQIVRKLLRYCTLSLGITLGIVLPLYLLVPWGIARFVNDDFLGAVPIFNVLLLWVSIYGVALINNQFLLSFHLQRQFMWVTLLFGLLAILLSYNLVQKYQGVGAALALLIAHTGSIIVQFFMVINAINKKTN